MMLGFKHNYYLILTILHRYAHHIAGYGYDSLTIINTIRLILVFKQYQYRRIFQPTCVTEMFLSCKMCPRYMSTQPTSKPGVASAEFKKPFSKWSNVVYMLTCISVRACVHACALL